LYNLTKTHRRSIGTGRPARLYCAIQELCSVQMLEKNAMSPSAVAVGSKRTMCVSPVYFPIFKSFRAWATLSDAMRTCY
jgi:hypothetical protein